jgi:hypothetical protein
MIARVEAGVDGRVVILFSISTDQEEVIPKICGVPFR